MPDRSSAPVLNRARNDPRADRIELLLLDVDGVLTDGAIQYTSDSQEIKTFHVRDGAALKFWHRAGKQSAIVSGRCSPMVARRAAELGIPIVLQGIDDKRQGLDHILSATSLHANQVCAIGDDITELPLFRACGLGVAVADAVEELKQAAAYVTSRPGGRGAVREVIEWLMWNQGSWHRLLEDIDPGEVRRIGRSAEFQG